MRLISLLFIVFCSVSTTLYGQYISSTTIQANNPVIYPNTLNNAIIRLEIEIGPNPVTLSQMEFSTNGSTSPNTDISSAKLFYSTDSGAFNVNLAILLGTCIAPWSTSTMFLTFPSGSYSGMSTFNGMVPGKNYFWLAYDIAPGATICNLLDGEINKFTVNNVISSPLVISPPGYSIIGNCPISIAEDLSSPEVIIYPIPSTDQITVDISYKNNTNVSVELLDITGKKIQTLVANQNSGNTRNTFPVNQYEAGFYFVKTIFDDKELLRKIIIQ